ncbi:Cyclin-related protein fam58a [Halocaridina rubra]|uniref:Cyclin-Q n=1 Tax=Halocaridina rubra TaxID=373956 RepID=A0AAN8ZXG3_HALRR
MSVLIPLGSDTRISKNGDGALTENLLEEKNPAIDYSKCPSQYAGARYIMECGMKLEANVLTIATAATYYHKFFQYATLREYDPYLIGSTCIYLASKVEDSDIKIRDIINVGVNCVKRNSLPLSLEPYFTIRDSVIHAELLLMRVLGFKLKVDLPHKYLLHYIQSLKDWLGEETFKSVPITEVAWTVIQDVYHTPIVLKYSPQLLAASILHFVNQIYGITVPGSDDVNERSWFIFLHKDCTAKSVWEVISKIFEVYKEEECLETIK